MVIDPGNRKIFFGSIKNMMIYFGGAVHSFTNPAANQVGIKGIAYNKKADERSWKYMETFFAEIFSN